MTDFLGNDYLMERRLKDLGPDLHKRFSDMVFACQNLLSNYKLIFPDYTDHSEFHAMNVINFCNKLIGTKNIEKLCPDEMYILLNSCYLHDVGMGTTPKLYEEFKEKVDVRSYTDSKPDAGIAYIIRNFHHEFSGLFIEKYADLFEFPSKEYTYAIKQIARGHRKTDLYDEQKYPSAYKLPNGNTVCLPYLAALIRLADEIDVVAERNPKLLYDLELLTDALEIQENKKLAAVKKLDFVQDSFVLVAEESDPETKEGLIKMVDKMQLTLDLCRDVIEKRTPFSLGQKKVLIHFS